MHRLVTKRTAKTSRRKREREIFETQTRYALFDWDRMWTFCQSRVSGLVESECVGPTSRSQAKTINRNRFDTSPVRSALTATAELLCSMIGTCSVA